MRAPIHYLLFRRLQPAGKALPILLAAYFSLLIMLTTNLLALAEEKDGILVKRDRHDNITVVVDPAMMPKIQANRQNGKIVIDVQIDAQKNPTNLPQGIQIDPVLTNAKVVDIKQTSTGKQISINTDAVYWDMRPLNAAPNLSTSSTPAKPADNQSPKAPTVAVPVKNKPPKSTTITTAKKMPRLSKTSGKNPLKKQATLKAKADDGFKPLPLDLPEQPQAKINGSARPIIKVKQSSPPKKMPGTSAQTVQMSATTLAPAAVIIKTTPQPSPSAPIQISAKASQQDTLTPAVLPAVLIEETATTSSNEANIPLNWDQQSDTANPNDPTSQQQSGLPTGTLLRITGALALVLLLLVGFMKGLLPKLLNRYPNLQQTGKQPQRQEKKPKRILKGHQALQRRDSHPQDDHDENSPNFNNPLDSIHQRYAQQPQQEPLYQDDPYFDPYVDDNTIEKRAFEAKQPITQSIVRSLEPLRLQRQPKKSWWPWGGSSQKSYIQRLGEQEDGFQLIHSSRLSRDKELHLVEIRGRHLVLATTPYSVNLITEIDPHRERAPFSQTRAFLDEAARNVEQRDEVYKKYLTGETAQRRQDDYHRLTGDRRNKIVNPQDVVVLDDYDDVFRF